MNLEKKKKTILLDISVSDTLAMQETQRRCNVLGDSAGFLLGEVSLFDDVLEQGTAVQLLEYHVEVRLILVPVDELDDVVAFLAHLEGAHFPKISNLGSFLPLYENRLVSEGIFTFSRFNYVYLETSTLTSLLVILYEFLSEIYPTPKMNLEQEKSKYLRSLHLVWLSSCLSTIFTAYSCPSSFEMHVLTEA